jgi:hypothetical protein
MIKVVQIYRLEREAVIEVEASTAYDAAELVGIGEVALPSYDDPAWSEARTLESENCFPA